MRQFIMSFNDVIRHQQVQDRKVIEEIKKIRSNEVDN